MPAKKQKPATPHYTPPPVPPGSQMDKLQKAVQHIVRVPKSAKKK